jgi:hypothetical protein
MGLHQVSSIFNFRFRARRWAFTLLAERDFGTSIEQLKLTPFLT